MQLETIKSSSDISALFRSGRRVSNRFLTLIFQEDRGGKSADEHGRQGRVAFIVGKKSGNACWRNAAKRRMREAARHIGAPWPGYDVLFVAKRGITDASYSKVLCAVEDMVSEAKLGKHGE